MKLLLRCMLESDQSSCYSNISQGPWMWLERILSSHLQWKPCIPSSRWLLCGIDRCVNPEAITDWWQTRINSLVAKKHCGVLHWSMFVNESGCSLPDPWLMDWLVAVECCRCVCVLTPTNGRHPTKPCTCSSTCTRWSWTVFGEHRPSPRSCSHEPTSRCKQWTDECWSVGSTSRHSWWFAVHPGWCSHGSGCAPRTVKETMQHDQKQWN